MAAEEGFFGCFSWVELPLPALACTGQQQLLGAAVPALGDAEFAARQEECRRQLARIDAQPLELPR